MLLLVVVLPASASNGEWGTFWITIGIAAVVLWFGVLSREQDRAYLNWEHFWATGEGPRDRRKKPQNSSGVLTREELEAYKKHVEQHGPTQRITRADMKRMREQGPDMCPKCGKQVYVNWRDVYVGGREIRTGMCPRCGEAITKVK